jgi:uncharacterized protein (TIGR03437 family)
MRYGVLISVTLAVALTSVVTPSVAATFGTVVPIGGHASDIALDESRGVLYVANFTANRIEVMSLADGSIRTSMNVAPQPGAISISPDNQFLLVAHFGNFSAPNTTQNALTLINLNDSTRQTFSTGDTPLGVAFLADGTAMVVTTAGLYQFDPISGVLNVLGTFTNLATSLPIKAGTFPTQVILASLDTTPDRNIVFGIAQDTNNLQAFYRYDLKKGTLFASAFPASPKPLPRVAVAADGSWAMMGEFKIDATQHFLNEFPNTVVSQNIGGNAVDSKAGILYSQFLLVNPPTIPVNSSSTSSTSSTTTPAATTPPVLFLLDADNLAVREQLVMPENITGRSILSSAGDVLYTVSDSGVMVMPVGKLKQFHRVTTAQSDVMVSGNFCNRNVIVQNLTITDPGGGNTDFVVSTNQAGVTISPSSGVTPATVQVRVDPTAFQTITGTVTVPLTVSSATAVNIPRSVRLLINNRNPDQRGTIVNVPGALTDILPDPKRNHFYILQRDLYQVAVFDSTTYQQVATMKTGTTPTQMAITFDQQYLIVGHDDTQFAYVYDLDTLQAQTPITFPGGHYPRQIAASGKSILSLVRDGTGNASLGGSIDVIDFAARKAVPLPTLGVYNNNVDPGGVLSAAPNGGSILVAMPDGNVMLYDANADTFTVSRKDYGKLTGGYAASSYNTYVVGQYLLNASLVTQATLETSSGVAGGFSFIDQTGFRTTIPGVTSPGVIQRVNPSQSLGIKPTKMVEAPLAATSLVPLMRTLAPLHDQSAVISLSVSGFMVLPWTYDAAVALPKISSIVNAADGTKPVAPGGLISIYGQQMSPVNLATKEIPLPTALGESCLTVNGIPVPMLFVSSTQINGQLPFNVDGNATMTLRTPGGVSDNFNFTIFSAAPSIFRSGTAGPDTGLATIVRTDNNQFVTPTNPIHPNDSLVIYATGLGRTLPAVDAGLPSPADPLGAAIIPPVVTLAGVPLNVVFAGLVPGEVGVYQINVTVPLRVPQGLNMPLVIDQGGSSTTLSVRVVN